MERARCQREVNGGIGVAKLKTICRQGSNLMAILAQRLNLAGHLDLSHAPIDEQLDAGDIAAVI
jgi:hypothetical protein